MSKPELKRATVMNTLRTLRLALALLIGLSVAPGAFADDIDIFLGLSGGSADAPNVMVLIDNGPNWSRQSQGWTDPAGAKITQGVENCRLCTRCSPISAPD